MCQTVPRKVGDSYFVSDIELPSLYSSLRNEGTSERSILSVQVDDASYGVPSEAKIISEIGRISYSDGKPA